MFSSQCVFHPPLSHKWHEVILFNWLLRWFQGGAALNLVSRAIDYLQVGLRNNLGGQAVDPQSCSVLCQTDPWRGPSVHIWRPPWARWAHACPGSGTGWGCGWITHQENVVSLSLSPSPMEERRKDILKRRSNMHNSTWSVRPASLAEDEGQDFQM